MDIAQALTLIFRSDGNVEQNRGVNITIIEINSTAANVSDYNYVHLCICNMKCTYKFVVVVLQWWGITKKEI